MTEKERSSGVQNLIEELRDKGVEEGKAEANELVTKARQEATKIVEDAKQQAETLLQSTREEVESLKSAGDDALRLAGRDSVLALKEQLTDYFSGEVRRLVSHSLRDEDFLRKLIVEIAGQALPKNDQPIELLVPQTILSSEEVEAEVSADKAGSLSYFVRGLTSEMLREGVTFAADPDGSPGLAVKIVGDDVEINFHDQAITEFLLRHLLPRFRTLMEGIGK